jgi:hypothetical protein
MNHEAVAAVCGVIGSYALASRRPWARYGWCAYLVSNVAWITFAVAGGHWWLLVQSVAFLGSSVLGCRNYVWSK